MQYPLLSPLVEEALGTAGHLLRQTGLWQEAALPVNSGAKRVGTFAQH